MKYNMRNTFLDEKLYTRYDSESTSRTRRVTRG